MAMLCWRAIGPIARFAESRAKRLWAGLLDLFPLRLMTLLLSRPTPTLRQSRLVDTFELAQVDRLVAAVSVQSQTSMILAEVFVQVLLLA